MDNKYLTVAGVAPVNFQAPAVTKPSAAYSAVENKTQERNSQDNKKLKLTLAALAVAGVAALGVAIALKKGKKVNIPMKNQGVSACADDIENTVQEGVQKLETGVKKFFNSAGESVDNIKLEKGKAIASDGSLFSGTLKTANKKGQQVAIEYADGFMQSSKVDGILKKTYDNVMDGNGFPIKGFTRSNGVSIQEFDAKGKPFKMTTNLFDESGKLKRTHSFSYDQAGYGKATEFFNNGKKKAEASYILDGVNIKDAKIYDEQGKLIKTIQMSDKDANVIHVSEQTSDGLKKIVTGRAHNNAPVTISSVDDIKFADSGREIQYFDKDNKLKKYINYNGSGG